MTRSALVAAALALSATAAAAQTPPGIADLVGARGAGGESELERRGWVHIKTEEGDDRKWSYWWQPALRQCVSVAVVNGRYDAITTSPNPDCNQRAEATSSPAPLAPPASAEKAKTNDLLTMRAAAADVILQRRGFKTLNAYQAGETAYTIRSNPATGQCIQVAVTDGRIRYIVPLGARACRSTR